MRFFVIVLALFVSGSANAQTEKTGAECRKNLTVDEFLLPDEVAAAKQAFNSLRSALLRGDHKQVIDLIDFPVTFVINGYPVRFNTARELTEKYKTVFTRYVVVSVRQQKPDELLAGWSGVSLANGAVKFSRSENGAFRITDVRPKRDRFPKDIADFLDRERLCPPVVVEGRIMAYNWVSHTFPGLLENIYLDHFIVDVTALVSGSVPQKRIRVDFWGVTNLPEYNLPPNVFEPGHLWRMYLRPAGEPPDHYSVCTKDVQESISSVDPSGREFEKRSAIKVLTDLDSPTYANLPCFEVRRQFFSEALKEVK